MLNRKPLRVAYAGHDFFSSCLRELISIQDVQIVVCLTEGPEGQPAKDILDLARTAGALTWTGPITPQRVLAMNRLNLDLLVCAAYMYRIPIEDLDVRRALNVHPTMLPEGRGPNPLPYLVSSERASSGVTIHELTPELDKGPILAQEPVHVSRSTTLDELYLILYAAAPTLLAKVVGDLEGHFLRKSSVIGGSYWPQMERGRLTAASATVRIAKDLHARFGMFGFDIHLADGSQFHASLVAAAKCQHTFAPGEKLADSEIGITVALIDGLARFNTNGALPPVE